MKGFLMTIVALMTLASARAKYSCAGLCSPNRPHPQCDYGEEPGLCGCEKRCYQGPGDVCGGYGGYLGKCSDRYFCDKSESNDGLDFNPIGECKSKLTSPCFVPCFLVRCAPPPKCQYGVGKEHCGCCDVCLKGPGEECGSFATCGYGYYCDSKPGAKYSTGVCASFLFAPSSGAKQIL